MRSKDAPDAECDDDAPPSMRGNALGGRAKPEDELLIDGQEEVFSRTEVELGRIEHKTGTPSSEPSPRSKRSE